VAARLKLKLAAREKQVAAPHLRGFDAQSRLGG
jgi:hypothetical protein